MSVRRDSLELWDAVRDVLTSSPKRRRLDRKESALVQHFVAVLRQYEEDELDVSEKTVVDRMEDADFDPDYDASVDSEVTYALPTDPNNPSMCRIGDMLVPIDDVRKAVEFYGSFGTATHNGLARPSFNTVRKRFPFVKKEQYLRKLQEFEKNGVKINLQNAIKWVSKELYTAVAQHLEEGHILHDKDLQAMAREIITQNNLDINFKASDRWIASWKKAHRITSRRITKFVARKRFVDAAAIQKKSQECVDHVKNLMTGYKPEEVFNGDQSGFVFEMHTMRTLARTGSKHVHVVVRSESNMKRSYTVLPLVNADGSFFPKLFIVLKEPGAKFPKSGIFKTHNLVVKAYTSHMMTKGLMLDFCRECVFHKSMPKKLLLLLDSWSSWKDTAAINSVKPRSNKLQTVIIPPGCTGHIQPLDVGVFGQFKKIIKTINAFAQRKHPDFHVSVRDNILKVVSLVFWQLCHSSLKEWVKQAWFSAGYIKDHPLPYDTPSQKLFPLDLGGRCELPSCTNCSFIRCLWCTKKICFNDFVIAYHYCC